MKKYPPPTIESRAQMGRSIVVPIRWTNGNSIGAAKKLQAVIDQHEAAGMTLHTVISDAGGVFRKSGALLVFRSA